MRRKHWGIVLAVVTMAGMLVGANGLSQGPTKTAVCDIRRAVVEYQKFINLKKDIEATQATAKTELESRRDQITKIIDQRKELKRGSPDDKKLEDLILEKSVEAQAYGEVTRNRLERRQYDGLKECYADVLKAMETYAAENGIDVVFSMRDVSMDEAKNSQDLETLIAAKYVLYSSKGIDITDAVLKQLNDAYKP
jgi:Skp family chaperone for outer membrane proteins